ERLGAGELDLGGGDGAGAELVLQPPDPHPVAGAVAALPQHQERRHRAVVAGQHHERGPVGVGGEPLRAGQFEGVAVGLGDRLQGGQVGSAGPLGEHLGGLAGVVAVREDLPYPLSDVLGGEPFGERDDHLAAGAERAAHADVGLVEQVGPGGGERVRVGAVRAGLLGEGGRGEVVGQDRLAGGVERGRHDDLADVAPPLVIFLQPWRVAVGLLRVGGDRAAHERAEPVEVRLGPGVAVAEVAAHEQLERRVAAPPVAPGGALVALGRVTVAGVERFHEITVVTPHTSEHCQRRTPNTTRLPWYSVRLHTLVPRTVRSSGPIGHGRRSGSPSSYTYRVPLLREPLDWLRYQRPSRETAPWIFSCPITYASLGSPSRSRFQRTTRPRGWSAAYSPEISVCGVVLRSSPTKENRAPLPATRQKSVCGMT